MKNRLTRREVLRLAALLGISPVAAQLAGCSDATGGLPDYSFDGEPGPETLFSHGVASGDPLPDAVVLWTRLSPDDAGEPLEVFWEVARDEAFADRVGAGWTTTDAERDFTVKLDAADLEPASTYWYRFRALGRTSPVGRTRTAPSGAADRLLLGVVSCQRYPDGYFHAYRRLAQRPEIDAIVHLGDYIYEDGFPGRVRAHDPAHEILSLDDYRRRYAQYRGDPDLQEAHRVFPFVAVWDDHETANNAWRDGASAHDPATEGSWEERKLRAQRVYAEWMPIRFAAGEPLFRVLGFGDLADLILLDTRIWGRDRQAEGFGDLETIRDPERSILGFDQEEWLADRLRASAARWKVVGQQVILSPWRLSGAPLSAGGGTIANEDGWDGYQPTRTRLLDVVRGEGIRNLVVLTGDVHSSWAMDVTDDPNEPAAYDPETGRGSLGVEVVAPGVSSTFVAEGFEDVILPQNPHVKYGDTRRQGYVVLELTPDQAKATWFLFDDVTRAETEERAAATFRTADGANHLVPDDVPV
ncbi:MAG: alkaline phosphatase D family protein [Thermodesulfobacteriota bacterium]